jgi:putative ABC transport system substrate-binding protein
MRRRAFLTTLCGVVAWPLAASPQERIPRIGYLSPDPADADAAHFLAFREGLRDLGYVVGKTIEIAAPVPRTRV